MGKKGVDVKSMTKANIQRFTFRLPESLFERAKAEAKRQGISANALLIHILWDWAEQNGLLDE